MFYKVPAGLCIYFITSSFWGICERKLLPKSQPKASDSTPPRTTGSNGWGNPNAGKRPKQRR
jgi:YidC/Oxa1 family membrane protein insertase